MALAPRAAAGWYSDPNAPGVKRYWDGRAWTQRTVPPTPALNAPQAESLAALPGPRGTSALTTGAIVAGAVIVDMGGF